MPRDLWRFRDLELDRRRFSLSRFGVPIKIDPKPLELLFLLADQEGVVVSHDEALRRVWGEGVYVDGESALYTAVKKIRRAVGDADLVQTVSGRGYRLRTEAFASPAPQAGATLQERLAILPLANTGGDLAEEYFSDGLTEELIATTAKLLQGRLGVIARTSVMRFKGVSRPVPEIARELGVNFLVEGSVRRQKDRVRISVQLLRAVDSVTLWSETFERPIDDVFALQREIALATVAAVRVNTAGGGEPGSGMHIDPQVHDRYLRGRHLWGQRTGPSIEAAMRYFHEVLMLDPLFAPAYAGLSCCHAVLPMTSGRDPAESFLQAQSFATKAMALDPSQAEAHIALGLVDFWYYRNWQAAIDHFQQAAAYNPGDSAGLMFLAHVRSILGQHDLAQATIAEARGLDPLSPIVGTHEGHFLYNAGRFEEALGPLSRVIELNPQFWVAHLMQGKALASSGQTAAALGAFEKSQSFSMGNMEPLAFRIHTLAGSGAIEAARAGLDEMAAVTASRPVPPLHRALAQLGIGDREAALNLIDEGFAQHDVRLIFLGVESRWRKLGDSAYCDVLERAGLGGFFPEVSS